MPRKAVIHHRPVAVYQLARGPVVLQHLGNVGDGFLLHGFLEVTAKTKILMLQRLHRKRDRLAHYQPLANKRPHKPVTARIGQQAVHLRIEHLGITQFIVLGQLPQLGIGRSADEHETQPRGNGVM